jgi:hypothetical protein
MFRRKKVLYCCHFLEIGLVEESTFMAITEEALSQFVTRMESVKVDKMFAVEEFKSTITCSSCFGVTSKQTVRLNGSFKTIKGAVVCKNTNCPRRLTCRSTTINRDYNGTNNIGLIGFSSVVSDNGMPIAPFQRTSYKSNKYVK